MEGKSHRHFKISPRKVMKHLSNRLNVVSSEGHEPHRKGRAVGKEGPKQQTFPGPEWFQPFLVGVDPSSTSWAPTLLCSSGGKTRQAHRAQRSSSPCRAAAGQAAWGSAVPLKGARACQSPFVEPPGADALALGLGRVGWNRAGRYPGTNRNASSKRRTPSAHSDLSCSRSFPTHSSHRPL